MPAITPTIGGALRPVLSLALGGLVPLLLYNGAWTSAAVLVTVTATYTGIRFGWTCFGPTPRLMTGFFWLFMYVFAGLAPLAQLASRRWPLGTGVPDARVEATAVIMLVFVISFDIAAWLTNRAKPPKTPTRAIRPTRIAPIAIFAVIAAAYEVYRIGGLSSLFTSRERLGQLIGQGETAFLGPIHSALLGVPLFMTAYLLIAARKTGQLGPRPLQIAAMTGLALVLTNPVSSSRYLLGTVVGGLILITLMPLKTTLYRFLLLGAAFALVFAFKVLDQFRYERSTVTGSINLDVREQFGHGDYDAFQQAAHIVIYVDSTGFHPMQLLGPLLFWVPRAMWPDKPMDTGVVVAEFFGFNFTNLSSPMPAELYVAGGLAAVVLGGVLVGWTWMRMDQRLVLYGPTGFVGLFVPVLAVYQFILLRGSLLQATGRIVVIAGLLWFATSKLPAKKKAPPHSPVCSEELEAAVRAGDKG